MLYFIKNILSEKCPRCHKGDMFINKWYQVSSTNKMIESCAVCGQRTQLEPGFFHGTGYISYALTVGFSIITFILWILVTDIGLKDSRIFYWLLGNVILLILLQPFFMRWSRMLWLSMFYKDDDQYHTFKEIKVESKNKK